MSETPIGDEVMARMTNLVKSTESIARIKVKIELTNYLLELMNGVKSKRELDALTKVFKKVESL